VCIALLAVRTLDGKLPWPVLPFAPTGSLRVLIIDDPHAADPLPESQRQIFYSSELDAHVKKLGGVIHPIPVGTDLSTAGKEWQDMYNRPRKGMPALIVARGPTVTYDDKLPLTLEETLKLIK